MSKLTLGSLDNNRLEELVLGRRPKWRDYVDLYFLLKDHVLLEDLINISQKKFGSDFSEKLFLEQLVFWDDVIDYGIEFLGTKVPKEKIKKFLEEEVRKYKKLSFGG